VLYTEPLFRSISVELATLHFWAVTGIVLPLRAKLTFPREIRRNLKMLELLLADYSSVNE